MTNTANLLTEHIDIWTATETEKKSGRGRASSNVGSVYGVRKLRELIYTLAICGKLLPQSQNDEPAFESINKTKLWRLKGYQSLNKNNDLPSSWILVPMEMLAAEVDYPIGDGDHGKIKPSCYSNSGIPYIRVADLGWGSFEPNGLVHIPENVHMENLKSELRPDDILIAKTGATIGKCCIVPPSIPRANTTSSVGKVTVNQSIVSPKWILCFFLSSAFKDKMWSVSIKTAQPGFNILDLKKFNVPIPPLAEQHRIVAKVDELMALCDQLEQQHSNAQEAHETLVSQLLVTLTQSQNAAEFNHNWQRIYAHFDVLFTTESSIVALKQTLLQLAVMGKLAPQDPNNEPASELLKRIQAEKAKLMAEGKLKKEKPLAPITEDEKPFELPKGWEWTRFNNLINPIYAISYGVLVPGLDETDGIPFVRIADLDINNPPIKPEKSISREIEAQYARTRLEGGEVLMGVVGSIGKLGVAPESWKGANIARAICRIKLSNSLNKEYVLWLLQSAFMQNNFIGDTKTLAQPTLNIALIRLALTPLPPLEEQHRIVAKVEALMALCNQLKTRIQQTNQQRQTIANALVAQAVS